MAVVIEELEVQSDAAPAAGAAPARAPAPPPLDEARLAAAIERELWRAVRIAAD